MIKTQILANEAGDNVLGKTYRCQKVGTLKDVPCVVSDPLHGGLIFFARFQFTLTKGEDNVEEIVIQAEREGRKSVIKGSSIESYKHVKDTRISMSWRENGKLMKEDFKIEEWKEFLKIVEVIRDGAGM